MGDSCLDLSSSRAITQPLPPADTQPMHLRHCNLIVMEKQQ